MAYTFRGRDRRLLAQATRDLALCLQRDYITFNKKKTTTLSTRTTFFNSYTGTWPNIYIVSGSTADQALNVLYQMIADLAGGSYGPSPNPDVKAPQSVTWPIVLAAFSAYSVTVAAAAASRGVTLPKMKKLPHVV